MIFSTYKFVLMFLPIVWGGYFLLNRFKFYTISKVWLVLASFYFYAQGSMEFLPTFIASVGFNYLFGVGLVKLEGHARQRLLKNIIFALGLIWNIGILGYYKYTDFFIENINSVAGTNIGLMHIILPIGISFYTFQLIAFLVDAYRGETRDYSFLNYLLFITFFPQLIVGPIIHHGEVVPQFEDIENQKFKPENVSLAAFIFVIGCAKKLLIADPLTTFAEPFFININESAPVWEAWINSITYTISYYFDLSAYADMAIGLGLFFNIKITQNFNSPYRALDFAEYWRRWHMTLSRFLNQYIFRNVFRKEKGAKSYYFAVMVTFFVSGFWHGAGWNFIVWGLFNGIFVCIASFSSRAGFKMWKPLAWFITFMGVIGTRILFVSNNFTDAAKAYKSMFNLAQYADVSKRAILSEIGTYLWSNAYVMIVLVIGMGITFLAPNTREITENFDGNKKKYAIITGFLFAVCLVQMSKVAKFLYFQF